MGYNSDFDDVQDELHRMHRTSKNNSVLAWVVVPLAFLVHSALLALTVWGATWMFGGSPTVIGVTCAAYVSAGLGWGLWKIEQRSKQTAIHVTSVHDEVLRVKELIQEEQRRSVM
jgi:hypothetical protein